MVSSAAILHGDELDKLPRRWWAIMLRGLLGILLGIVAFFMPVATLLALVYLFGAYAFFDGVFNLMAAWRHTNRQKPWWALLLSGIAGIGASAISFAWPGITALALVYVVSAWALVTGGLEIAAAVKLRKEIEGEWLLALSGIFSMVLGFLLAFFPETGAIGLVWYLGAYAIVFGILMVALSVRLRTRRVHDHSQPAQVAA
jgi:uncharacterized membrane protein HdeD (DUF308 family)